MLQHEIDLIQNQKLKVKLDQVSALLDKAVFKEIIQNGLFVTLVFTKDGKDIKIWTEEYDHTLYIDGARLEP